MQNLIICGAYAALLLGPCYTQAAELSIRVTNISLERDIATLTVDITDADTLKRVSAPLLVAEVGSVFRVRVAAKLPGGAVTDCSSACYTIEGIVNKVAGKDGPSGLRYSLGGTYRFGPGQPEENEFETHGMWLLARPPQ